MERLPRAGAYDIIVSTPEGSLQPLAPSTMHYNLSQLLFRSYLSFSVKL
jgi:hypothetical protein